MENIIYSARYNASFYFVTGNKKNIWEKKNNSEL